MRQHAVQENLGFYAAFFCLVESLPFSKMPPLASDRAVSGTVAVRDDEQGVVMEGVGDDVLVHVVGQVVVKTLADIPVDSLSAR